MTNLKLSKERLILLEKILSRVGDLNFRRRIIKMLEYLDLKKSDRVLDMGCGEGFYSLILDKIYECEVIALDNDPHILGLAKNWVGKSKNVKFEIADICNLRFNEGYFDKIICTEVLEHIIDHERAIKELNRVLKPGGILAVTVPNKNYPLMWDPINKVREFFHLGHFDPMKGLLGGIWAYDHKRLYSSDDLYKLLKFGDFYIPEMDALTHYGVPFNHLVLYIGKNMYTRLPVPDELKKSMEKFEWENSQKTQNKSFITKIVDLVFGIIKWVDSFNNRKFSLSTSAMAIAAKAVKSSKRVL